jgi:hypothetical protein
MLVGVGDPAIGVHDERGAREAHQAVFLDVATPEPGV